METDGKQAAKSKAFWLPKGRDRFGPGVELARVSSTDRNSRFVVALGALKLDGGRGYSPVVLGGGDSYESAMRDSETSETGRLAAKQWQDFIEEKTKQIEQIRKDNDDLNQSAKQQSAPEGQDDASNRNDSEGPGSMTAKNGK